MDTSTINTTNPLNVSLEINPVTTPAAWDALGYRSLGFASSSIPIDPWFTKNIKDPEVMTWANYLAADGNLSRTDMIILFRNVEDNGVITDKELGDLRTIVKDDKGPFTIDDSVQNLANKIVNSNNANQKSGIGNLTNNSSATQMENLVDKWFFGNNHPIIDSSFTYQKASGNLFQGGISGNDVIQRNSNDCYYLVALSAWADNSPSEIQNMFIDNGDDTYTVKFVNKDKIDYVTVDKYLATDSQGHFAYANSNSDSLYNDSSNKLWVSLAEKAYAQLAELGWSRSGDSTNSYKSIDEGLVTDAVAQLAMSTSTQQNALKTASKNILSMTQAQVISLVNSNAIMTLSFNNGSTSIYALDYGIYNNHAYNITSYNSANNTFCLRDPLGTNDVFITWSQILSLKPNNGRRVGGFSLRLGC